MFMTLRLLDRVCNIDRENPRLMIGYGKDRSARLAALERKYPEEFATQGAETLGMQIELRTRLLLAELGGPPEDVPMLAAALSESALLELPKLAQGLTQVLSELVSKIPLVIISNTSWTSGTTTRALLAKTHLAAYTSYLACSDEVGWAKPSPLIFEAAWRSLRIDPAHTVHVGDNLKRDHAGATAVGATSVISRVLRKIREPGGDPGSCHLLGLCRFAFPSFVSRNWSIAR
jgi:FMN phosphatase YigB (HAD superfamily)